MKKIVSLLYALSLFLSVQSQANYSGVYGYTVSKDAQSASKDKEAVPGGRLVLLKIEENAYRFWLDVLSGPPQYSRGETDGTIRFINDTASFDNSFEEAEQDCFIKFKINGKTIEVSSSSNSYNCGFGDGVSANGSYTWLADQDILDNAWLEKQYPHAARIPVTKEILELYQDEEGVRSFPKKRFLKKGDSFLNIAETEKTIFTEFISKEGLLVFGWIRKTDVKTN